MTPSIDRECSSGGRRVFLASLILCLASFVSSAHSGPGNALLFDSSQGDVVIIPHSPMLSFNSTSQATFELWLMFTDYAYWGIAHLLGKRGQCWTNDDLNYQLAGDHYGFGLGSLYCSTEIPDWPVLGRWTHIAVSCDGDSFRMYIDGQLTNAVACEFGGENIASLVIGGSSDCGNTFPGVIDEVRIWNVARTPQEIADCFYHTISGSAPGLVACWHFDEDSLDQNVIDSSGFGHNGTLGQDLAVSGEDPTRISSTAPLDEAGLPGGRGEVNQCNEPMLIYPPRPHPTLERSTITFYLANGGMTDLSVFDVMGAHVGTIEHRFDGPGEHSVTWPPAVGIRAGMYFLRLTQNGQSVQIKVVVLGN
jgi:hypothetical protein